MLSLARRLVEAPKCAARSLMGGFRSRVGREPRGSPSPSARQSPASAGRGGRRLASASASAQPSPPFHFGPKIPWDAERDGDVINAEAMCAAFALSGFPRTKTLNFKVGHVLKDHAHKKRGYKRVGIAEGGKFIIRPKGWSGAAAAERAQAAATSASLSDVELSPGDAVDIPPGLLHAAWVVGDEAVVFIMGDEEEGE